VTAVSPVVMVAVTMAAMAMMVVMVFRGWYDDCLRRAG